MHIFLRLRHWQIFLLLVCIPMILEFTIIGIMIATENLKIMIVIFPLIMVLVIAIFFGWFYALGINLHKKLPETVNMNLKLFKVFLFAPLVYMLFLSFFIFNLFSSAAVNGELPNAIMLALLIPVHFFSMFCIFYCLYFISKAMKSVELQRQVTFSDYAGEFFLIWFFPIGVWIIQPRINKLFDETEQITNNFLS